VIAMTKASQVFGLNRDAVGVWSERELSNSIEPEAGVADLKMPARHRV
jgi:hypothetical protein